MTEDVSSAPDANFRRPPAIPGLPDRGGARSLAEVLSMLSPDGVPRDVVLYSPSLPKYLAQAPGRESDVGAVRRALRWLAGGSRADRVEAALKKLTRRGPVRIGDDRLLRMDAAAQQAVRTSLTPETHRLAARAAAEALYDVWLGFELETLDAGDGEGELDERTERLLLDNTIALCEAAGEALWHPDLHPLLLHYGGHLRESDRHPDEKALGYLRELVAQCTRILGPDARGTLAARQQEAFTIGQMGDTAGAVAVQQALLDARLRALGHDHEDTIAARALLGHALHADGRTDEGIPLVEAAHADAVRTASDESLFVDVVRDHLADVYEAAGRTDDARALRDADGVGS